MRETVPCVKCHPKGAHDNFGRGFRRRISRTAPSGLPTD